MRARILCVWLVVCASKTCVPCEVLWIRAWVSTTDCRMSFSAATLIRQDTSPRITARMSPMRLAAPAAVLNHSNQVIALPFSGRRRPHPSPPTAVSWLALCWGLLARSPAGRGHVLGFLLQEFFKGDVFGSP